MKTIILAGGMGTRLSEETDMRPKPLVEIGGRPMLWHIMRGYGHFGFTDFIVALGYKGEQIKRYFVDYGVYGGDVAVDLKSGKVASIGNGNGLDWTVSLVDTGLLTSTGGRLRRLQPHVGTETFMLTYGDGVSDIPIPDLVAFHKRTGCLATITAVRPPARFGGISFDGDIVSAFTEKPQIGEGWINGGFMVMEPGVFDFLHGDEDVLEVDLLERLAAKRQLAAYRHEGFWQCMDTLRDRRYLESLWAGEAPWRLWRDMTASDATFWRDRPTFVTGGTGLVGSWLVKALVDAGAEVVCLIRDWVPESELVRTGAVTRVRVVRGDLGDQALLERVLGEYEIATVLHLAAQTIVGVANRNPISTFESNVAGTWRLLEAARRSPTVQQIVVASSDKAYGDAESLPYDEALPLAGRHPYDVSKSCADLIAQSYWHSFDLPVAITRCGNFYGGGDLNWNRIVPGTIRAIIRGERPIIRSDGTFVRDYIYVEDAVRAYMLLAEAMAGRDDLGGEAFNFSNETQVSVLALVSRILAVMDSTLEPVILNEATNEIRDQYLSAAKARRMLDWGPAFTLDAGLERTVAWYRDYFDAP